MEGGMRVGFLGVNIEVQSARTGDVAIHFFDDSEV
jgi:hypothetical protein